MSNYVGLGIYSLDSTVGSTYLTHSRGGGSAHTDGVGAIKTGAGPQDIVGSANTS